MAPTPIRPEHNMPFSDKVFYVVSGAFLVVLATGLWLVFVEAKMERGVPLSLLSVIGLAATLVERERLKAIDRPLGTQSS